MANPFDSGSIKKYLPIVILLLLIIPSIWFLLLPGFFESDDGGWMVIRFSAFYQALADGQFPVRFLGRLNHGFGYPVANFLYPGFMYFAVPIHALGLNFVDTIKAVLVFSISATAVFSYFWLSKIFDRFSAIAGSVIITYAPYHLFDLYKRGSVGELFAFVWVALVLWMIETKNLLLISFGIFLLAISHNTMFLFFAPLLFAYSLIRKTISFKKTLIAFILGILMSSFFTIPAIYELQFTNFASTKISNISQYFVSFGLIGLSTFFILALSLFVFLRDKKKNPLFAIFFLVSILSIFLSLSFSESIWRFLPSNLIQFPFRLLSYLIFGVGFLAAFTINKLNKARIVISIVVIALLIFSAYEYIIPTKRVFRDESFYFTNEATTTVQDEYMPKWVEQKPTEHFKAKVEIIKGKGRVENISYNSKKISFDYASDSPSVIRVNTIYYPGWKAYVNGKESKIDYSNESGVMEISFGKGLGRVEFVFTETPLRFFADIVSLSSLIVLIVISQTKLIRRVPS